MKFHNRSFFVAGALALGVFGPLPALAGIIPTVTILDTTEINAPQGTATGFGNVLAQVTTHEGPSVLGTYSLTALYTSANPLGLGQVYSASYNMGLGEGGPGTTSDTLSIVLVGVGSVLGNNMEAVVTFASDSLDNFSPHFWPTPLTGGVSTGETLELTNIAGTGLDIFAFSPGPVPGAGPLGLGFLTLAGILAKARVAKGFERRRGMA